MSIIAFKGIAFNRKGKKDFSGRTNVIVTATKKGEMLHLVSK